MNQDAKEDEGSNKGTGVCYAAPPPAASISGTISCFSLSRIPFKAPEVLMTEPTTSASNVDDVDDGRKRKRILRSSQEVQYASNCNCMLFIQYY